MYMCYRGLPTDWFAYKRVNEAVDHVEVYHVEALSLIELTDPTASECVVWCYRSLDMNSLD